METIVSRQPITLNELEKKHRLKFSRTSVVNFKGVQFDIDVYECMVCKRIMIIDRHSRLKISFEGGIGEEIGEE